ncbi:MAG: DUF423 domain-containing protein [Proteobacteria bacterium]|nr:DUF423 domain-containing protein [Pseudomonadota bacterium]
MKVWLAIGALSALAAAALGAVGAHGVATDEAARQTFETANRYHMWHALGVIVVALSTMKLQSKLLPIAAALLFAGSILFPGPLYLSSLLGDRSLSFLAPVGGITLMAGWLLFAVAALGAKSDVQ